MNTNTIKILVLQGCAYKGAPAMGLGDQVRGVVSIAVIASQLGIPYELYFGLEAVEEKFNEKDLVDSFTISEKIKYVSFENKAHCYEFLSSKANYNGAYIISNGYGDWPKVPKPIKNEVASKILNYLGISRIAKASERVALHIRVKDLELPSQKSKDILKDFQNRYSCKETSILSNSMLLKEGILHKGVDSNSHFFLNPTKEHLEELSEDFKIMISSSLIEHYSEYKWTSGLVEIARVLFDCKTINLKGEQDKGNSLKKIRQLLQKYKNIFKRFIETFKTAGYFFRMPVSSRSLIMVTGADESHEKSLLQLLESVDKNYPELALEYWDLGLSPKMLKLLDSRFPRYVCKTFIFKDFPNYFDIKIRAGQYAWKPVIICDALSRNENIIWMDSGNTISGKLRLVRSILLSDGYYFTRSGGRLSDWTHAFMLRKFKLMDSRLKYKENLNAASLAFSNTPEIKQIVESWKECALHKDCISPDGSSRVNHRQDQAALSSIVYSSVSHVNISMRVGFKTHQDID